MNEKEECFKALLNDEGVRHWGDVFPDHAIPVKGPFQGETKLDEDEFKADVYIVAWNALTQEQKDAVLEKLLAKFAGATKISIEHQIRTQGLPLQAKYVSSVPIPLRFFI